MKITKILVKTKSKNYPIYFGIGIIESINSLIEKNLSNVRKICIIIDKKISSKITKRLTESLVDNYNLKVLKLNAGEKIKNFKYAYNLTEKILKFNLNRSDCIIVLGGGTLGDLTSFVASLTKRGVKLINIPSTLLAQVDSSIGGKTAINSIQGKNLIGTFYQPDFVLVDILLLKTLSKKEMVCGYGEILKHSLIANKKFFYWLTKNAEQIINKKNNKIIKSAVIQSCKIKSKIVSNDEKEKNIRMILNFGHTFAHGLEGASGFSKKINHGEAVLLGMMLASNLSYIKKLLPLSDFTLIKKHYADLNLPAKIKKLFKKKEMNKIISFMKKDKKNFNEKINLILIKKIGSVTKPNSIKIGANEIKKFLLENYK